MRPRMQRVPSTSALFRPLESMPSTFRFLAPACRLRRPGVAARRVILVSGIAVETHFVWTATEQEALARYDLPGLLAAQRRSLAKAKAARSKSGLIGVVMNRRIFTAQLKISENQKTVYLLNKGFRDKDLAAAVAYDIAALRFDHPKYAPSDPPMQGLSRWRSCTATARPRMCDAARALAVVTT